jgi:hypothetical protein
MTTLVKASSNCDKPIPSSERMLYKDYDNKGSVEKKSLVVNLKGLGGKSPVIN